MVILSAQKPLLVVALLATAFSPEAGKGGHVRPEVVEMSEETELTLELNEIHRELLRQAKLYWSPAEVGAPGLFFGDLDAIDAIESEEEIDKVFRREMLEVVRSSGIVAEEEEIDKAIATLDDALEVFLDHGELPPGEYECDWQAIELWSGEPVPGPGSRFELSKEHLALIRFMSVRDQGGLPYIDPKRPYGDMTYFQLDMAIALDEPLPPDGEPFSPEEEARYSGLHQEMLPALLVFLRHAEIEYGTYAHEEYTRPWDKQ